MILEKISLENFRNIKNMTVEPDSKMNVLCGSNGQGKTNILEAIWLFTGAKSFRGAAAEEMICFGENKAVIKIEYSVNGIKSDAEIHLGEHRKILLNGNTVKGRTSLAGNFYAVQFSPNDISLVSEGPAVRRKFLDTAIFQIYPKYAEISKRYLRAVKQRNSAIKDLQHHFEIAGIVDAFDNEIAENGRKIIEYRRRYIDLLKETVPPLYYGISDKKEQLSVSYGCNCSAEFLAERLKEARKSDMYTGTTSVGPHRDDLILTLNGNEARAFGSQGQKRSVALSLKLAEAEIIKNKTDEVSVILLDDVMSELDPKRQNYVLNHIKGRQVFITCCDPGNTENLLSGKIYTVENGTLSEFCK